MFPSFFPKVNYGNSFWTFINVQFYFQLFQIGKNTLKTRHSNYSIEFYRILVCKLFHLFNPSERITCFFRKVHFTIISHFFSTSASYMICRIRWGTSGYIFGCILSWASLASFGNFHSFGPGLRLGLGFFEAWHIL